MDRRTKGPASVAPHSVMTVPVGSSEQQQREGSKAALSKATPGSSACWYPYLLTSAAGDCSSRRTSPDTETKLYAGSRRVLYPARGAHSSSSWAAGPNGRHNMPSSSPPLVTFVCRRICEGRDLRLSQRGDSYTR